MNLLRSRPVALWWSSTLVSAVGSLAMFVALPLVVFQRTHSTLATSLTAFAGLLPPVLLGPVAGVLADRHEQRRILVGANLLLAALTVGYLGLGRAPWWALAALALVIASVNQLVGPAAHALLPRLVAADQLGQAAAVDTLGQNLARLIGPVVGGFLLARFGFRGAALLDAASYAVAALLTLGIRDGDTTPRSAPAPVIEKTGRRVTAGLRGAWQHPKLRIVLVACAVTAAGEGCISSLFAPYVQTALHTGAEGLGLIFTFQAAGGILGSLWATRLGQRPPLRSLSRAGFAAGLLLAASFLYPLWYPQLWPTLALTAVAGLPFAIFRAARNYALQLYSPPERRGSIYAATLSTAGAAQLTFTLAAGALAQHFSVWVIILDAIGYLAVPLLCWLNRRPEAE